MIADSTLEIRHSSLSSAAFLLKRMAGRQVQLPGKRDFWPDKTHLAWHRVNRFADSRKHNLHNGLDCTHRFRDRNAHAEGVTVKP